MPRESSMLLRDGDAGFLGVNQAVPPGELQPGEVPDAQNARCTDGDYATRLGVAKLPWTNLVGTDSDTPLPFGVIRGATTFRDPDDQEWLIIAADGKCYATMESGNATEIRLPPGVSIDEDVTFMQAFNGLIMFRGADEPDLVLEDVDDGWNFVVQEANTISGAGTENPASGTDAIPNADSGEWVGNRAFIPYTSDADGKDLLAISDYLNATRYAPIRSSARINQGSSDALVRYFKFSDTKGICFKEGSLYGLYNTQFDLDEMYLDAISTEIGTKSPRGVVHVGREGREQQPSMVWFMSEKRGVMAIVEGDQGKLQVLAVPVSREIQRLIERIDWRNQHLIRAEQWQNKVYFAVPLDESKNYGPDVLEDAAGDGSRLANVIPGYTYQWVKNDSTSLDNGPDEYTDGQEFEAEGVFVTAFGDAGNTATLRRVFDTTNNAILVYDLIRQKWAGHDTGTALMVKEFVKTTYLGPRRLFFVSTDGFINLMEEQFFDDAAYETPDDTNLASGSYDALGNKQITVIPGRRYSIDADVFELGFTNGTETVVMAEGDNASFVAQNTVVTLLGAPGELVGAEVYLITWALAVEWIEFDVTFRGLRCGVNGRKRFTKGRMELATWFPEYSITAETEGANEEREVIPDRTKSRTRYYKPFNKTPWDETNADDDHATEFREDYSLVLNDDTVASGAILPGVVYYVESSNADPDTACGINYNGNVVAGLTTFTGVAGVTTFTTASGTPLVYPPGSYVFLGENGIDVDLHQESWEPFRLPGVRGREVRYRVRSTQGRIVVKAIEVEGLPVDKGMRVAA